MRALDPALSFPSLLKDLGDSLESLRQAVTDHLTGLPAEQSVDRGAVDTACNKVATELSYFVHGNENAASATAATDALVVSMASLRQQLDNTLRDLEARIATGNTALQETSTDLATRVDAHNQRLESYNQRLEEIVVVRAAVHRHSHP